MLFDTDFFLIEEKRDQKLDKSKKSYYGGFRIVN